MACCGSILLWLLACRGAPDRQPVSEEDSTVEVGWDGELELGPLDVAPGDDLSGLEGLPCSQGLGCASGPPLGDTCCSFGDALEPVSFDALIEGVDIEVDDRYVMVCTGFGLAMARQTLPLRFEVYGDRCQRLELGSPAGDTSRHLWATHHGDSMRPDPALWTYHISSEGTLAIQSLLEEPEVLYGGVRAAGDHLYVGAHSGGLRVYELDGRGVPTFVRAVDGFANARKLDLGGGVAWVTDEDSLHGLDLSDPADPIRLAEVGLPGRPRDVEVYGDQVYVALGGEGFAVVDGSDPDAPVVTHHVDAEGSVQAVAVSEDVLATANWTFVSTWDRSSLVRLAGEKTRPEFEEDLGIALYGDRIYALEWFGVASMKPRAGWVAPHLHITQDLYSFAPDKPDTRMLRMLNLGPLDLAIYDTATSHEAFSVSPVSLTIPAGEAEEMAVSYTPTPSPLQATLQLSTNDPDASVEALPLVVQSGDLLTVGDTLPEVFGFLDPSGQGDVDNLRGRVTVVAYFALF